jgi:hypothetical protein
MTTPVEAVLNSPILNADEFIPIQYSQSDREEIVRNIYDLIKERNEENHEVAFFEYSPSDETYHFTLYGQKEFTFLKNDIYTQDIEKAAREFFRDDGDRMQDSMPCAGMTIIDGVFHRVFTGSDRVHWGVYQRVFTTSVPPFEERRVHSKLPHKVVDYFERRLGVFILDIFLRCIFTDLKEMISLSNTSERD